MQRALLKIATPVSGPYKVGDIVLYCRQPRKEEIGIQWSIGSRIVGFEVDAEDATREPVNAWLICDGIPILVAVNKLRPCTASELLAYTYMAKQNPDVVSHAHQQRFVDERAIDVP